MVQRGRNSLDVGGLTKLPYLPTTQSVKRAYHRLRGSRIFQQLSCRKRSMREAEIAVVAIQHRMKTARRSKLEDDDARPRRLWVFRWSRRCRCRRRGCAAPAHG